MHTLMRLLRRGDDVMDVTGSFRTSLVSLLRRGYVAAEALGGHGSFRTSLVSLLRRQKLTSAGTSAP